MLLERETEETKVTRAVELDVLLLDASNGHWTSDKSGERLRGATPTKTQLFEYDVVIFGEDVGALGGVFRITDGTHAGRLVEFAPDATALQFIGTVFRRG